MHRYVDTYGMRAHTSDMTEMQTPNPREIDEQIEALELQGQRILSTAGAIVEAVHRALGERKQRVGRREAWPTLDVDAVAALRAADPMTATASDLLAKLDAARAQLADIEAQADALEATYAEHRWSRFFIVVSSDGHIHSSRSCSTCRFTTVYGWLPKLSGLTEAEAVADQGPLLCSVCFPSAPAEWTRGRPAQTAEEAAADGKCINRVGDNYRWLGGAHYGDCPTCGARGVAATESGLRKHTHERAQQEAARAARRNDPKLIGTPDGDELRVGSDILRTVRTAEIAYVDAMMWAAYADRNRPDAPEIAGQHRTHAGTILAALAAKAGTTTEATAAKLATRVVRKLREMGM